MSEGQRPGLQRTLGLWAVVGLGLSYMGPTVVFDTFGIISERTNGVVPLAYLIAMLVMIFTAMSYGKISKIFPSAGSAYVYTKETMGHKLGFMVGWAALLDYMLLPIVNAVAIRIYMDALLPEVSSWVWVVAYVVIATGIIVWSMEKTSDFNKILLTYGVALIFCFLILAWLKLQQGTGHGTLFTTQPLFHDEIRITSLLNGASIVAFSFIGFDAITMYSEEAVNERVVPRAIVLAVLIIGIIFFISSYFSQALFPDVSSFKMIDDTLPEIALYTGGQIFKLFFISAALAIAVASGISSHASVARLLYVMGRNGVLPTRLFGYVHPRFQTPAFNVVLVGVVTLLAIGPSLELMVSAINFGALIAFTFVNFALIFYFVENRRDYVNINAMTILMYIIIPGTGALLTGALWLYISTDALIGGLSWLVIGICYMAFLTSFFRKPLPDMNG